MRIDITGNWVWQDAPAKGLIVSQPEPPKEGNLFTQTLEMPSGEYRLEILYLSKCDHYPMQAMFYKPQRFPIIINGRKYDLFFSRIGDSGDYIAKLRFVHTGGRLTMEARVQDTHFFNSTVLETDAEFETSVYRALPVCGESEVTFVRGIPFLSCHGSEKLGMWNTHRWLSKPKPRWAMADWTEGAVDCGDTPADMLFCLGMTHCYDVSNGSWYSKVGDHGFHHFIGDRVGTLRLAYTDDTNDDIPLVYGVNVWYGMPWDLVWQQQNNWGQYPDMRASDHTMFFGSPEARETVQRCIGLDDGIRRMGEQNNERYIFALKLDGRKLRSVQVLPAEDKYGEVTIAAMTLKTAGESSLVSLPELGADEERLTVHTVGEDFSEKIEALRHVFYTFVDELPELDAPIIPRGYIGPHYPMEGTQDALLAATYLYRNGPECGTFISDDGMECLSNTARWRTTVYMSGTGLIFAARPTYDGIEDFLEKYNSREAGEFPGLRSSWSRGIGELMREAVSVGFDKCIDNYVNWLDSCLFNYANPPHWNRSMALNPEGYQERMVGDVLERGNRENDGHGICMWGRYMVWHKKGRNEEWNRAHWEATKAACEWLQWQLDVDTVFPGVRKDILYTESECAHGDYDTYSTGNCLHALDLSIRMAKQLGKTEETERWTKLYDRLAKGMLNELIDESEFGPIWHTEEKCDWQDHAHKLVHLQLSTEGNTFTPLEDYTEGTHAALLAIDKNSYRYLTREKRTDFLRMYGYGQGMMTQSALLMDDMAYAEKLMHMLLTHCYLPRMEGFLAPEGIVTHESGKFYMPVNGYMGLDSHLADSVKAVRLMLGIDDNNPDRLRIVPRFPEGWKKAGAEDFPALIAGKPGRVSYVIARENGGFRFEMTATEAAEAAVRVGPFSEKPAGTATVNGISRSIEPFFSGDSWWAWVDGLSTANTVTIEIRKER